VKIIYGGPSSVLTVGMALLGNVSTPFIGFTNPIDYNRFSTIDDDTPVEDVITEIEKTGGTIIYIENPDAASRLHEIMSILF
jgi:hypothetical protein